MRKTVFVISWVLLTVDVGFLAELILSVSISVSNMSTVERSMLSIVSVIVDCTVSTMIVPGPDTVVET